VRARARVCVCVCVWCVPRSRIKQSHLFSVSNLLFRFYFLTANRFLTTLLIEIVGFNTEICTQFYTYTLAVAERKIEKKKKEGGEERERERERKENSEI